MQTNSEKWLLFGYQESEEKIDPRMWKKCKQENANKKSQWDMDWKEKKKREKEIGKVPAGPTNTLRHETESQRESRKRGNEKWECKKCKQENAK